MKRYEAIKIICKHFKDSNFISTLGFTSKELYAIHDGNNNFYMLGSMGIASSFGFGVALASPERHIVVFDGDGSILMNLGSLTTIGSYNLKNYLLVIFDNGVYETTGSQKTNTSRGTDLYTIALGSNCYPVYQFNNLGELKNKLSSIINGILIAKVCLKNEQTKDITLSPQFIMNRFKEDIQSIKTT